MGRSPISSNAPADMNAPRTRAGGCRLSPTDGDRVRVRRHLLERRRSRAELVELGVRQAARAILRIACREAHHTLRRVDGQATQTDRVDDGEERGVDADAEAKGEHRVNGESRAAAQMADGVTQVAAQVLEPARTNAHRGAGLSRAPRCPSRGARPGAPRLVSCRGADTPPRAARDAPSSRARARPRWESSGRARAIGERIVSSSHRRGRLQAADCRGAEAPASTPIAAPPSDRRAWRGAPARYDASAATPQNVTTTAAKVVTSSGVIPNRSPSR